MAVRLIEIEIAQQSPAASEATVSRQNPIGIQKRAEPLRCDRTTLWSPCTALVAPEDSGFRVDVELAGTVALAAEVPLHSYYSVAGKGAFEAVG